MRLKKALASILSTCFTLTSIVTLSAASADVDNFLIAKGQRFSQTNSATPSLTAASNQPFRGNALVVPSSPGSVVGASIKAPSGVSETLSLDGDRFDAEAEYTNKLSMDRELRAGAYTFTITGASDGVKKPVIALPADAYPSTPHISNWTDAQNVEADQPFTLMWDAFAGGTTNDYIIIQIETQDGTTVFNTPFILEANALDGTPTSVTIPANTFGWGTSYNARIMFIKRSVITTTAYPGAIGLGGYYKETAFSIVTQSAPPAGGRIEFSASNFLVHENDGTVSFLITRSGSSGAVTVDFSTISGTAQDGVDYTDLVQHVSSGVISFADGQTTATNASVILVDNMILNSNKTFTIHLSNPTGGAVLGARTDAVVTIVENESKSAGTFQFLKTTATVAEGGKSVLVTVTRTGGSSGTVTVDFHTGDGVAQSGFDYTGTNGTLVFAPGKAVQTISIPILNDTLSEIPEAFYVYLDSVSSPGILGANFMATVNITSDDAAGSLSIASATYSISETGTNLTIKVNRSGGAASDVTVDYATAPGSATAGLDFTDTHGTLTFAAKETTKTIVIPILDNNTADGNRQFTFVLSHAGGGGALGKIPVATITVLDDEPSIAFETPFYTVGEAGVVTVKLVRTGPLTTPASVTYQTANLSATAGADYTGSNGTVQFPAKVASKTITIPILKDTIVEGPENFNVLLTGATGVQLGRTTQAIVTINDDDHGGTINFSAATYSGTEGGNVAITLKRTGGLASGVTVQFTMSGGTATSGVDYTNMTQVVTFNANEVSKTITVPLIQDVTTENAETVNLTLSDEHGGANIGTLANAVLTIKNKPDPNAVPVSGATFMKGTFGGAAFTATPASVIGAQTGSGLTINAVWISGSGFSTTSHQLSIVVNPLGLGQISIDNSGTHGLLAVVAGGISGAKGYGVGSGSSTAGTYGTVTIDGIDLPNHRVSGRFTFHARETTGNVAGPFIDISGSFRENAQ